jgi:hypothetical protein
MTQNNPVFQTGSDLELDTGLLIHPRPAPFTGGRGRLSALVRDGHGRW